MYFALLVCSDGDCDAVYEAYGSLKELEALGCDCGFGLAILGWPERLEGKAVNGRGLELAFAEHV